MGHVYNTREEHGKREKQKPNKLKAIHLERSANGGLMVSHRMELFDGNDETHTFGPDEHRKAMEHVVHHLGLKESKAAGATSGQANKETDKD